MTLQKIHHRPAPLYFVVGPPPLDRFNWTRIGVERGQLSSVPAPCRVDPPHRERVVQGVTGLTL
jgi:hypothetical protein